MIPHDILESSEPITEAWLRSVGFEPVPSPMDKDYGHHMEKGRLNVWEFNGTGVWLFNDADWIGVKTRGELRMLARLAKVELED
jgi:hypothetical protein